MMPAMVPNQAEYCAICGRSSTQVPEFNDHHVLARSLGGQETIRICIDCHNRIHAQEWRYKLSVTDDRVYLLDNDKIVVDRPRTIPDGFDEGIFVASLQNAPQALRQAAVRFRFLSDDGLVAAGEAMAQVSDVAWELRARLFQTALKRTPWGDKDRVLMDVAKQFGLERAQARREAQLIGWVDAHPEVSSVLDNLPPVEVLRHIQAAQDPEAAAELYVDRKAADPGYTRQQFAAEVKGVERTWCTHNACPECGAGLPHYRKEQA